MTILFRIEYVFENPRRKDPQILAAQLNHLDYNFQLTESLLLGGYEVKSCTMPRALDNEGKPRFDLFEFQLKDKSNLIHFKKGQEVVLIE